MERYGIQQTLFGDHVVIEYLKNGFFRMMTDIPPFATEEEAKRKIAEMESAQETPEP